ncbi:hypothetical protein [Tardiphaga robiniae]|uniref:Nitrate reductase n=1 Tax=Tardiphaga robiniae TaxID=943830 RepID=A0A7G6TSU4_9BRAD|nr:hypothetical protein [Tardiphaga robiniae]QND69826.1 hypothetical protein HB776_00095 [Tardiphaga robiniae]
MKPNLFLSPRRTKSGYREAVAWIKAETRSALRLDDDTTVSVSELSCSDPGCPDVETVIEAVDCTLDPAAMILQRPDIH